ncbi:MAG: hypothetical protein QOJ27_2558 [Sphingomonadales bacterium]|nr:hypothetical protein [Sphingomonadales bacterium]
MAGDEETWGLGRWPRKRRRPPPPDWEDFTGKVKGDLLALGMDEDQAKAEAELKCRRTRMRHDWFSERMEAFYAMQDQAGEACLQYMAARPDIDWESGDAPLVPEPPEKALAQAIYAEVIAAVHEDRWPRHLHFRDI